MTEEYKNKIAELIHQEMIYPEHCSYDEKGVWVKNDNLRIEIFTESSNPRLLFARTLSFFPCKIYMAGDRTNQIASNTKYDIRKVIFGDWCVIGGVGFGYERDEHGNLYQMPHVGNVIIGDNVVIHNQVNIDRAVIGSTIIGEGTKIDSLVHVGHGAKVGENVLIVSGVVLGGSCEIGDNTFLGMNASVKNKIKVGCNVTIGMNAVVTKDVPDNVTVIGNPAKEFVKQ